MTKSPSAGRLVERSRTALRTAGVLLGASLLASSLPPAARAAVADATAEVKVILTVLANPSLFVVGNGLETRIVSQSGYGFHEETTAGSAGFADRTFTAGVSASALAISPPDSKSVIGFGLKPGQFLQLANPTNVAQTVDVEFSGNIVLSASASRGYSAATGFYALSAYQVGGPTFTFNDFCKIRNDEFKECSKSGRATFVVAPQDAYSFLVDHVFAGAVAYVPEPSTWTLALLGFGGLGAALRQRRGASATC